MSEVILWMADNLPVWRPFAISGLAIVALACVWWALTGWNR